ncbi:hypothetical protein SDC9_105135 [bioreactor metagenome]|uniref:Uncharacterized protein n=1 Tax=bioreactor metagenome TaxID=1076179 RepID=A0A645B9F4_9ZZZZ
MELRILHERRDRGRIAVSDVDGRADLRRYLGGKGQLQPAALHTGFGIVAAGAAGVGGMRQYAPRHVLELVPLLHVVVAAVVADLVDLGVGFGHGRDVRGVEDRLAAVRHGRLGLVEALGCGPDVVIALRDLRDDVLERRVDVLDVGLGGHLRLLGPGSLGAAE